MNNRQLKALKALKKLEEREKAFNDFHNAVDDLKKELINLPFLHKIIKYLNNKL